jgi:hypothetical protein
LISNINLITMNKVPAFEADPEKIILIGEKIIHQHISLGPDSPLSNGAIADLNSRISRAREKHEEGMKYKRLMENAWQDRDLYLGSEEKGVISTLKSIHHSLKEHNLKISDWGI